jgi:peptidyl-dipeptidase A
MTALLGSGLLLLACGASKSSSSTAAEGAAGSTQRPKAFVTAQVQQLKPMALDANLSWYQASVTGTDKAWARSKESQDKLNRFFADPARFAQVKAYRDADDTDDPLVARQIEVLYLSMLGKQVAPDLLEKITGVESDVEKSFNTFRGQIDGRQVTTNEIKEILRSSTKEPELKAAWEAQKAVGALVAPRLKELVKLRNQVARELGYRDYYALRIAENEQDEDDLLDLFDELDDLTRGPFLERKAEVDRRLAKRLGIGVEALMPWHYQNPFFQEPPAVFETGLDALYRKHDTLKVCRSFYESFGMEVKGILERSDLYEKEGKTPHAFAADIDREGDIRVLANIVPGIDWMGTMVHELGHAVYDLYIDQNLPWLLRNRSHPLTTEGVAMMLDRLVVNPHWAFALELIDEKQRDEAMAEAELQLAFAPLQFSRWTQVMLRFERAMYAEPDADLNALWWDLVEKYQGLTRPPSRNAPDYASKIHLVIVPVYYHNYMMGEIFAAQVHEKLAKIEGKSVTEAVYIGHPEMGEFLKRELFAPGARLRWDELTRSVTGDDLSAEAFARRFESD